MRPEQCSPITGEQSGHGDGSAAPAASPVAPSVRSADESGASPIHGQRPPWVVAIVAAVALVVFVAGLAVQNLPPTPARQVLLPWASRVIDPLFNQHWTLFAPAPPEVNEDFVVEATYRPGSGLAPPRPVDLTTLFRTMAKQARWAPPRLYRVTMSLAVELNRVLQVIVAEHDDAIPGVKPAGSVPALAAQVQAAQDYYASSVLGTKPPLGTTGALQLGVLVVQMLQRLGSATARAVMPHPHELAAIKVIYRVTPIAPYTDRQRVERSHVLLATAWLPYLGSVPT